MVNIGNIFYLDILNNSIYNCCWSVYFNFSLTFLSLFELEEGGREENTILQLVTI